MEPLVVKGGEFTVSPRDLEGSEVHVSECANSSKFVEKSAGGSAGGSRAGRRIRMCGDEPRSLRIWQRRY